MNSKVRGVVDGAGKGEFDHLLEAAVPAADCAGRGLFAVLAVTRYRDAPRG